MGPCGTSSRERWQRRPPRAQPPPAAQRGPPPSTPPWPFPSSRCRRDWPGPHPLPPPLLGGRKHHCYVHERVTYFREEGSHADLPPLPGCKVIYASDSSRRTVTVPHPDNPNLTAFRHLARLNPYVGGESLHEALEIANGTYGSENVEEHVFNGVTFLVLRPPAKVPPPSALPPAPAPPVPALPSQGASGSGKVTGRVTFASTASAPQAASAPKDLRVAGPSSLAMAAGAAAAAKAPPAAKAGVASSSKPPSATRRSLFPSKSGPPLGTGSRTMQNLALMKRALDSRGGQKQLQSSSASLGGSSRSSKAASASAPSSASKAKPVADGEGFFVVGKDGRSPALDKGPKGPSSSVGTSPSRLGNNLFNRLSRSAAASPSAGGRSESRSSLLESPAAAPSGAGSGASPSN